MVFQAGTKTRNSKARMGHYNAWHKPSWMTTREESQTGDSPCRLSHIFSGSEGQMSVSCVRMFFHVISKYLIITSSFPAHLLDCFFLIFLGWFQKIAKLWILLVPAVLCITQSYTLSCAFHLLCLQFIQFLTVTVRVVHEIAQTICSIFFLSIDLFNPNFYLTIIFCAIKQVFCTFWCQQFSVRFCSSKF